MSIYWIIVYKPIQINPAHFSYWVSDQPSAQYRPIKAISIIVKSCFFIVRLGGELHGLAQGIDRAPGPAEGIVLVGGGHFSVAVQERGDVPLAVVEIGISRPVLIQSQQAADPPRQAQAIGLFVYKFIGPVRLRR